MLLNYEKETSYWLAPRLAARFSAILHPNSTNGERRASLLVRLFISNHGNRLQLLRWFRLVLELRDEVRKYQLYDIPGGLPMIGGFLTLSFKYWLRESGGELNGLVGWTGSRMWELFPGQIVGVALIAGGRQTARPRPHAGVSKTQQLRPSKLWSMRE
jgi:hypothetical protein